MSQPISRHVNTPNHGIEWDAGRLLADIIRAATYQYGPDAEPHIPSMLLDTTADTLRLMVKDSLIERLDVTFIAAAAKMLADAAKMAGDDLDEAAYDPPTH